MGFRASRVRSLVVALSAVLTACADPVAPDQDLVEVSVEAALSEMSIGEPNLLVAIARNPTDLPLTVQVGGCFLSMELRDSEDNRFIEPGVCIDTAFPEVLGPDEELRRTVVFDGTGWRTSGGKALVPGRYRLRATLSSLVENLSPFVELSLLP